MERRRDTMAEGIRIDAREREDDEGRILLVDTENHAVRRIDLVKKTVVTVLGERAVKNQTTLKRPHGIDYSPEFGFMVGDSENHRVLLAK